MPSPRSAAVAGALALVLLSSCGRSPDEEPAASVTTPTTVAAAPTTLAEPETTTAPEDTSDVPATEGPTTPALEKPEVQIPDEIPTELVITDLKEGTGPAAESGSTVV